MKTRSTWRAFPSLRSPVGGGNSPDAYLPQATRRAITKAMEQAGARATPDRPLAWIRLETNRATFRHELSRRFWPDGGGPVLLSEAHPHGAWVEWRGAGDGEQPPS